MLMWAAQILRAVEFAAPTRYGPSCPYCHGNKNEDWGYVERGPDRGHTEHCGLRSFLDMVEQGEGKLND